MRLINFLLVFILTNIVGPAFSQDNSVTFQINEIRSEDTAKIQGLEVYANVKQGNTDVDFASLTINRVIEHMEGSSDTMLLRHLETKPVSSVSNVSVIFLLDVSGSMNGEKFEKAKTAIANAILNNNFPEGSTFFATFHDDISRNQPISRKNYREILDNARLGKDTDLYAAIKEKVEDLKKMGRGKKILILVSDGKNDNNKNPNYIQPGGRSRVSEEELINNVVRPLDGNFGIFAIGVGDSSQSAQDLGMDARFLRLLVGTTAYKKDGFSHAQSPDNLDAVLSTIVKGVLYNVVFKVYPKVSCYNGTERIMTFEYSYNNHGTTITGYSSPFTYTFGTPAASECLNPPDVPKLSLSGVLLLAVLLLCFVFLFPFLLYQKFKRKHVTTFREYKRRHDIRTTVIDNYTTMPIQDHDKVVTKCNHIMTLGSWIDNNDHCYEYPMRCENGVGNYRRNAGFFRQTGSDRSLNWLWFGALGGLLAWVCYNLVQKINLDFYTAFIKEIFPQDENVQTAGTIMNQSLVGMAMGFFISLMLSVAEERGQSRQVSITRIYMRSVVALVISIPMFAVLEWLRLRYVPNELVGQLIEWLLFGSLIGYIVTLDSGIETVKGLKGGLLAAFIAFWVYYIPYQFIKEANYANYLHSIGLLSWMMYGAILGFVLVTVVQRLEDFELETISPDKYAHRKIPISKWLKTREVYIGSHPSCDVKIKWADDKVAAQHAIMTYDGNVYIEPYRKEEVLVNSRLIGGKTKLKHGDLIQLGTKSITILKFIAKLTNEAPAPAQTTQQAPRRIVIKSKTT